MACTPTHLFVPIRKIYVRCERVWKNTTPPLETQLRVTSAPRTPDSLSNSPADAGPMLQKHWLPLAETTPFFFSMGMRRSGEAKAQEGRRNGMYMIVHRTTIPNTSMCAASTRTRRLSIPASALTPRHPSAVRPALGANERASAARQERP